MASVQIAEVWWYFDSVLKDSANRCLVAQDSSSKFAASFIKVCQGRGKEQVVLVGARGIFVRDLSRTHERKPGTDVGSIEPAGALL